MPSPLKVLKDNIPYAYVVVGALWFVMAFVNGSILLLWPTVACLAGATLLRLRPDQRLTWAWATSAAVMGLLLSLYQAYAAFPLLFGEYKTFPLFFGWYASFPVTFGAFSIIAASSLVVFAIFAVGHLLLAYVENVSAPKSP